MHYSSSLQYPSRENEIKQHFDFFHVVCNKNNCLFKEIHEFWNVHIWINISTNEIWKADCRWGSNYYSNQPFFCAQNHRWIISIRKIGKISIIGKKREKCSLHFSKPLTHNYLFFPGSNSKSCYIYCQQNSITWEKSGISWNNR